ncbi:abortive infection family protein [Bacillus manliponensis]|uniref:abortive infection family protein n=1 Tax=Bacillus manliponensis TaxID=574376 RepID=UPI0035184BB0
MHNQSIFLLDNCKKRLINTYDAYMENKKGVFDFNYCLSDEEYREARRIITSIYKINDQELPEVLRKCRDVSEFVYHYSSRNYDYNYGHLEALEEMSNVFNVVLDYLEEQNIEIKVIKVECDIPNELTYQNLIDKVKRCDDRIEQQDYSGAITLARSVVEGVCKEIVLNLTNEKLTGNEDLLKLFKIVRNELNLNPNNEKLKRPLKEVLSGLIKVVEGLNAIRNINGDAHYNKNKINLHHALLVVNSVKTLVTFLFDTYEYQREKKVLQINK